MISLIFFMISLVGEGLRLWLLCSFAIRLYFAGAHFFLDFFPKPCGLKSSSSGDAEERTVLS